MAKELKTLLPGRQKILTGLGENIKFARLRRRLSLAQVSERAGISVPTLIAVEKGIGSVSMGSFVEVLAVLGLEKDLAKVGTDDILGRKLQDLGLPLRVRAPKRKRVDNEPTD